MTRLLVCFGVLLGAALGQELEPEEKDRSPRAARMRKQAQAMWENAAPVVQALGLNQKPTPEEAAVATRTLEEAVVLFEKAVRAEWHMEANATLARAIVAWHDLRKYLPQPSPADEEARKEAAREQEKQRRARAKQVRRFILDYGRARRFEKQFRTCSRCDGRGDVYDAFNRGKRPCAACHREGRMPIREGIIRAHWHFLSPLYRAQPRSATEARRALGAAARSPHKLAPFVRSVTIREVEDHDLWVRVDVLEKTFNEPGSKKTFKTEKSYLLYRVGKSWYLYSRRSDKKLVEIPD
ncbi:MAG: DnaJ-like cysteine-rich domain-containing protein [Planctomycetota bacterium]